ncbi:MAG: DUF1254 domain-containing protein [Nitrospirota bacterium]|nr:DUF1254 domain-containing protein [Nitrospirota bacterium]MDH5773412.1 DUF1254 domain-containing protein [Nitrospirota bacterium]
MVKSAIARIKASALLGALLIVSTTGSAWAQESTHGTHAADSSKEMFSANGIEMVNGVPTTESSKRLFDAMDYYGAVMTYMWAMPAVGLKGWENANVDMGADPSLDGQISFYHGYDEVAGILTPNTSVTYVISFVDLAVHGPAVWVIPPGATAGYVGDQWQRPVLDTGLPGADRGKGVKLLIVGPGQEIPTHDDSYTVVHCPTNVVWLGTRDMEPMGPAHERVNAGFDSYPFNRPDLKGRSKLRKTGDAFPLYQPHGMEFWENLNTIIQREKMAERDVFFYAMLKNLGIEKGKSFQPDAAKKALLIEAERVGYLMAINNAFKKRFAGARYYEDRRWYTPLINNPDQIEPTYGQLFERASWFHEAIGSTYAMKITKAGPGSTYIAQYEDENGIGFDGGKNYTLTVPADVPAAQFWAFTVYDSHGRTLIQNKQKMAEVNSQNKVSKNEDGTTTIYVGPRAPAKGLESNWIPTSEGQAWFSYFRFYTPKTPYFDKSWKLNDIKQVE